VHRSEHEQRAERILDVAAELLPHRLAAAAELLGLIVRNAIEWREEPDPSTLHTLAPKVVAMVEHLHAVLTSESRGTPNGQE